MIPRTVLVLMLAAIGWLLAPPHMTSATASPHIGISATEGHVEIIKISGNLDRTAVSFVTDRIDVAAISGATGAVIQLDSRATLSEAVHHLVARIKDPPLPLAVWVGPSPASAYGGAAAILAAAPIKAAAPGVRIGHASPVVAGRTDTSAPTGVLADHADASITVTEPIDGLVDIVAPSISNLLVAIDGRVVTVRGERSAPLTIERTDSGIVPVETVFHEPGVGMSTLRIATGAETAFFLLMIGLAVAAFEFYALGPGIAAGVAAVCLLLSGYGLSVLPVRGWALALALVSIGLLTAGFQRGGVGPLTWSGAGSMLVAGLFLTDAAPQIQPSWWLILVIVISVTVFYLIGMRTVARARFSTPTIGRDHMVGMSGAAMTGFHPDGVVEVNQARWKATAHREAGISPGDPVVIRSVKGQILRVEPAPRDEAIPEPEQPEPESEPA